MKKNPLGGIHHLCFEVDDIIMARDHLRNEGARILGEGEPRIGAHGKPVLFLHPKDFIGTLVELEEADIQVDISDEDKKIPVEDDDEPSPEEEQEDEEGTKGEKKKKETKEK